MDAVSKLKVLFEADSSALDKAFGDVDKKASGLTGVFGKVTGALGSIGLAGMGISAISGAVGGVVGSFGELIGAAEGVGDAAARIGLVWDQEMIGIVEDNATIANSLGLTKAAYMDQVGALGQLATSLGVNSDAAADMAMGLTELAPKLAAYAGVEGTVASDALEKALMGKTKGLAALGIAITDADQQSAALALGLGTEAAKWTEAEKAQINYAAVLDKTGAAQSAWADNQGDVEVSMQRVSAAIEDAKAALGEKLLPILAPVAEAFASMLPGAIDTAVSAFGPFLDAMKNLADGDLWAFFGEIGTAIENVTGITGLADSFDAFGSRVQDAMDTAKTAFGWFMEGFNADPDMSFIERIREGIGGLAAVFGAEKGAGMGEFFASVGTAVDSFMQGVNNAKPGVEAFIDGMVEKFNYFKDEIYPVIKDTVMPVIDEMVAALGDGFAIAAPIVTDLAAKFVEFGNALTEKVWPILKPIFEFVQEHSKVFALLAGVIMMVAGGPITMLVGALISIGLVVPALVAAWDSFKAKLEEIGAATNAKIAEWQAGWQGFKDGVAASWQAMKDSISEAIQSARDTVDNTQQAIQDKIGAAQDWILDKIHEVWNAIPADIREDLVKIATHVAEKWEEFKTTIATKSAEIVAMVSEKFAAVRDAIVGPLEEFIAAAGIKWEQFKASVAQAMEGVKEIAVNAFMALVTAWDTHIQPIVDKAKAVFDSVKNAVTEKINAVVNAIKEALGRGKTEADKKATEIKEGILKPITDAVGKVTKLGSDIIAGLVKALNDGKDAVRDALLAMVRGGLDAVKSFLGIASPSKVFAQIGEWITLGLASGIQKQDYKAVEALAKIITQMTTVANGLADFGKKIAEMIVPDDAQIAAAKEKYLRMTMILTDFIKSISYLGSLLPVSSLGQAGPGQIRAINAGLVQLSQSFPAIRELQGMTAENLLTGGEADWAGRLADTVGKIAGVWGGIADSMTKIASAKFPTDDQLKAIKESTIRIALWATDSLKTETLPSAGAAEFAASMKSVVDALATVAGLDLAKITRVAQEQLDVAKDNIGLIGKWGYQIVTDWLKVAGDDKARAAWVASLKDFADTTSAAANILKAGDVGSLADIAVVTQGQLDTARANIGAAGKFAWELVTAWVKNAGDSAARAKWIADLKDFADTIGAAVSIFKTGADASGKLETVTLVQLGSLDVIKQNLINIASMVADLAKWSFGFAEGFKVWSENVKTAVDIFKAGADASKTLDSVTLVTLGQFDTIKQNIINIASVVEDLARWSFVWPVEFKAWVDNLKTALDIFKAGADASKMLTDVTTPTADQMGAIKFNLIAIGRAMLELTKWKPVWPETFNEWATNLKTALDIFKAGADASKTLAGVTDFTWEQMSIVKFNLVAIGRAMLEVSKWKPEWPENFDVWAKGVSTAVSLFASVSKAMADIGTSGAAPDLSSKLGPMKDAIKAMFDVIGELAKDISVEEAKARADLAEAIARAASAMGDFSGGIGGLMELAESKLFGSTAGRAGMGHTQRTRTNRADFFAQQLGDTVKRAVGAVQDALNGITLTVDDKKVAALAALGDAFGKIADGLTKLAEAKMPNAKQLAEISAALLGAQGLGGGVGGGGNAGGPVTLNLSNPSLVFATPVTASVQVTTTPTIMIGTRTIETLATMIESKLAEKFTIGTGGGGSPITTGP